MAGRRCNQIKALLIKDWIIHKRSWLYMLIVFCAPIAFTWAACFLAKEGMAIKNAWQVIFSEPSTMVNTSFQMSRIEVQNFPKKCYYTPGSPEILELLDFIREIDQKIEFVYAENEKVMVNMSQNTHGNASGLVFNSSRPESNFTIRTSTREHQEVKQWNSFISFHWEITSFELKNNTTLEPYFNQPPFYDTLDRKRMEIDPEKFLAFSLINTLHAVNFFLYLHAGGSIASEMERGLKELLRMMGLADSTFWLAKFFNYFPMLLLQVPIMVLIVYNTLGGSVFGDIPILLFIAMVLALFISNLLVSFILVAIVVCSFLAMVVIPLSMFNEKAFYSGQSSLIEMFLFPANLFGTWLENYIDKKSDLISFLIPFLFIPFAALYILILLYIDAVCPWQKGTVRSFYFPCQISGKKIDPESIEFEMDCDPKLVEKVSGEAGIICSKVTKVFRTFRSEDKIAVNNVSVKVIKNSITVLLGHNGAGKTTLMNMITGFTSPTSGVVYLNGYDNQTDMVIARESIALCPQHDCFYDNLTVEENLQLFANVGGNDPEMVTKTIQFLNLGEKSSALASELSGGMRRRVQLGMALVTDADTLILDEPTSGLDPETRRTVWDYLIQLRARKTILITTHFMEEAEALADQIIIMSGGRIKCIGSQVFLKTRLGAGYSVKMEKKSFNHDATVKLIAQFYPKAILTSDTSEEIVFNLAIGSEEGRENSFLDSIAQFCDTLDLKKDELGINSFTITTATLEDVFMKIAVDEGLVGKDQVTFAQVKDTTIAELRETLDYDQKKGSGSFFSCYWGLLVKRWHHLGRNISSLHVSITYPLFLITILTENRLIPNGAMKTFDLPNNLVSPNTYSGQLSVVLSASPNSTLRKCFNDINSQYEVKMIIIDETIDEYLRKHEENKSDHSSHLFAIQDQGTVDEIILFGTLSHPVSKAIVVGNYLNILRCVGTGEKTLINAREHEFPRRIGYDEFLEKSAQGRRMFLSSLPLPLGYVFATMYLYPGMEVEKKTDLVQRMAGSGDYSYWISNLTYDMIHYSFISAVMVVAILSKSEEVLFATDIIVASLILFVLACFLELSLIYLFTFRRMEAWSGYSIVSTLFYFFAVVGTYIERVGGNIPSKMQENPYFKWIKLLGIFPSAMLIIGLGTILHAAVIVHTCDSMRDIFQQQFEKQEENFDAYIKKFCLDGVKPNYLELLWPDFMFLLISGTILFVVVIFTSKHSHKLSECCSLFCTSCIRKPAEPDERDDEDVLEEKKRVETLVKDKKFSEEALVAHKLTKDFYNCSMNCRCNGLRAVHNVSFTVHKKECFGLLGVNGAGKTTTFSMLVGDEMMTRGHAYVGQLEVSKDLVKYREHVSYCPQQDALLELLTPEETLTLFARLRGIPGKDIGKNVEYIISRTDLDEFRKTLNCNLSGGNKRKLGLAIATVGGPSVMFLDEPTTGVDPASRRKIWGTLIGLRESGRSSIVLTSHSMDECEAICNRIAIMAKGQIRCLGSSTHLKSKYGQGFTLIINLKERSAIPSLLEYIKNLFPTAKLLDEHGNTLQFHLPDPNLRWGNMFRSMKQVKEKFSVEDFSIYDTSIEQIFLSFAHAESSREE
ncbi:phospholipid-transporting ATPase ABCA3-like [Brevipalpus obovatus]|uniref:phospholipid-transporting ATPase ABCA3-like n=1 Tax=Brevipalpus obovatus TaxID=246614 RepID=UPI003D9E97FE